MKTKIAVFFVVVFLVAVTVSVAMAESYTESSCNHYTWINVPGPDGKSAIWITTDPAVIVTKLGSYTLLGRTFVISHTPFTLGGVPFTNTWGCYFTGGYYPPQTRADEITSGLNPSECVFLSESGEITVNAPVSGSCVLPEPPAPTPTLTPEPTATLTPIPSTPTPKPTKTLTPIPPTPTLFHPTRPWPPMWPTEIPNYSVCRWARITPFPRDFDRWWCYRHYPLPSNK